MKRQQRTARELADMITARLGIGGVHVMEHPDWSTDGNLQS
jgi:hypothetical protein